MRGRKRDDFNGCSTIKASSCDNIRHVIKTKESAENPGYARAKRIPCCLKTLAFIEHSHHSAKNLFFFSIFSSFCSSDLIASAAKEGSGR